MVLGLLLFSNANAEERENELNNLFKQLKNSEATKAIEIENQIWKIWSIHPSSDRKGYRLTELLAQGSFLIAEKELNRAYEIFSQFKTKSLVSSFLNKSKNIDAKDGVIIIVPTSLLIFMLSQIAVT